MISPDVEAICSEAPATATVPGLASIIVPCYRGDRYLREALQSCLSQSYAPLEVIVVDDASPDGCLAIAREFETNDERVRVIARKKNGGVAQAFNTGFAAARGEYLTRLAQDDIFEPFAVETMVARLESASSGTGLVYCDLTCIDESGEFLCRLSLPPPDIALRYSNQVGVCVMFTRDVWKAIGEFSSQFDTAEDYEYWTRVAGRFDMVKCDGPSLLRFRLHAEMGSIVFARKQIANTFKVIDAMSAKQPGTWSNWRDGRIRLSLGHLTAAMGLTEIKSYSEALSHLARSFYNWPLPLPAAAFPDRPRQLLRCRMLATLIGRTIRSLETTTTTTEKGASARECE